MTSRDRKRAKRRATRRLADWRDRWAPFPLGRGAAPRAKTARREVFAAAQGAVVLARNAYHEMHSVQCPRSDGSAMHARTFRHKMDGGAALRTIMAPYRRRIRAAEQARDFVQGMNWRQFYRQRISFDIGCADGIGALHVWEYTASGFELVRSERLGK